MSKTTILLCGPPQSAMGGGPTHIRSLLSSPLRERFHLVHFETGSRGTESPAKDEAWPNAALRIVLSPFALARQVHRSRPSVVHLNSSLDPKGFWRDLTYMIVAKLLGCKVVLQFHGGSLAELCRPPGMRRLTRVAFSMPDALVVLAASERRELSDLVVGARVSIVPNGVDVAQYADERVHSGKVTRMAFLGRLIRPKGVFEAMEAVRLLRTEPEFSSLELWIAGSGPAREEIERWIREHSMEGAVTLAGSIYGPAKIDFLRKADVLVFPTYHVEGLPYAILESLAAGTPVIATRVAGIPDVIVDRVHGILIDARSPGQVVDAVHELSRSAEGLRAMSVNCRARAAQEYSLEIMAARFEALYNGLEEPPLPRAADDTAPPLPPAPAPGAPRGPAERGLLFWLIALAVFGGGGVLLGEQELALLVAMSGLFVAAQAADLEPRWAGLYGALAWVVPVATAAVFAGIAVLIFQADLGIGLKSVLLGFACASVAACLAGGLRPVADGLARLLLGADPPSRSLRLSAQLIVAGLLLAVPGWFALRDVLAEESQNLMEQFSLGSGLLGYVLLALAAAGFLVRRNLRATLDRLGLKTITLRDAGIIVLGVLGLLLLNHGADWFQQHAFPELWKRDQAFNEALAGGLSGTQAVLLGMSAGIGEEITMRGALQPRLGLVLTALLFASLHIQYSWYGMTVIFMLGIILGAIRQRTSTTAAMAVHVIYDIVAILTT